MRLLCLCLLACGCFTEPEPPLLLPEQALELWDGEVGRCSFDLDDIELTYVRTARQIVGACGLDPSIEWTGCYWGPNEGVDYRPPRIWYRTTTALPHELAHWLMDCSGEAERLGMVELGHGHPLFEETINTLKEEQDALGTQ